ncbi:MAG: hypothetical protein ACRCW9_06175 [Cetobacterium sp.]
MGRLDAFKKKLESQEKELYVIVCNKFTGELVKELDLTEEEINLLLEERKNEQTKVQPELSDDILNKWKAFH